MSDTPRSRGSVALCNENPVTYLVQDDSLDAVGWIVGKGKDWEAYVGRDSATARSIGKTKVFEAAILEIFRVHDAKMQVLAAEVRGTWGRHFE